MGLQGMINDLISQCDFATGGSLNGELKEIIHTDFRAVARLISTVENFPDQSEALLNALSKTPVQKSFLFWGLQVLVAQENRAWWMNW